MIGDTFVVDEVNVSASNDRAARAGRLDTRVEKDKNNSSSASTGRGKSPEREASNVEEVECWICRDSTSETENPILHNVCRCTGSIGAVHQECIDYWVFSRRSTICSSCGTPYNIISGEYPEGAHYPALFGEQAHFVLRYLVLPLFGQLSNFAVALVVRHVLPAVVIGAMFYWRECCTLARVCISGPSAGWQEAYEAASELERKNMLPEYAMRANAAPPSWLPLRPLCWLLLNLVVLGAAVVASVRSCFAGREGWRAFFADSTPLLHIGIPEQLFGDDEDIANIRAEAGAVNGQAGGDVIGDRNVGGENNGDLPAEVDENQQQGMGEELMHDMNASNTVEALFVSIEQWRITLGVMEKLPFLAMKALVEIAFGVPLAYLINTPVKMAAMAVVVMIATVAWRFVWPPKEVRNNRRRYQEILDRKGEVTPEEEYRLYVTFVFGVFLFSFLVPVGAGILLRYSSAPFFVAPPQSLAFVFDCLCPVKVLLYWMIGTCCSAVLMYMEGNLMMPVFAPGVDIFFLRAIDVRTDVEGNYWCFTFKQVFDADPLRLIANGLTMAVVYFLALYFFVIIGIVCAISIRILLWDDVRRGRLVFPLDRGFPVEFPLSGYNLTTPEWLRLQAARMVKETSEYFYGVNNITRPAPILTPEDARDMLQGTWPLMRYGLMDITGSGFMCRSLAVVAPFFYTDLLGAPHGEMFKKYRDTMAANPEYPTEQLLRDFVTETINEIDGKIGGAERRERLVKVENLGGCYAAGTVVLFSKLPVLRIVANPLTWIDFSFPGFFTVLADVHLLVMVLTLVGCLTNFPLLRLQLRVAFYVGNALAKMLGMWFFFFDEARVAALKEYLRNPHWNVLRMPPIPAEQAMLRRDRIVAPEALPTHLKLRLAVFSVLFYFATVMCFWTLPVLFAVPLFTIMPFGFQLVVTSCNIALFACNPHQYVGNLAMSIAVLILVMWYIVAWPISVVYVIFTFRTLLVRETFEYHYKIKRKVGSYDDVEEYSADEEGEEMMQQRQQAMGSGRGASADAGEVAHAVGEQ